MENDVRNVKQCKKELLLDSAVTLFKSKGIQNTTVSDITKSANVAKGTFYLYFEDKNEIVNTVIMSEASKILDVALEKSKSVESNVLSDKIIFIANELITAFVSNVQDIEIVHKNLFKGLFEKHDNQKNLFSKAVNEFIKASHTEEKDIKKREKRLYIMIEMIGGVCYNSIAHKTPYSIDDIKDELFYVIRKIVD